MPAASKPTTPAASPPATSPSVSERLDHLEAVVKANNLHEPTCRALRHLKQSATTEWNPGLCDCWLKETGGIGDIYTQLAVRDKGRQ